jgi:hypothetical protein
LEVSDQIHAPAALTQYPLVEGWMGQIVPLEALAVIRNGIISMENVN